MASFLFCPSCGKPLETAQLNQRERLVCSEGCGFVHWDNPLPVVGAIVEYDNDTVILIQNKGWPAEWYGIVSGFLEKGESPEEAVLREVKEELGLAAEMVERLGVYSFFQRNELIIAYHVRASGEIRMDEEELQAYKIVPIQKLRPWPFGTGLAVKEWLEKRDEIQE
ncbi:NUDIX domain-containing protein [Runella slithyformis]|uniref:NUDIX hydrolase n=1 Tax=Runella slithyformis (strain ATCC 29530 / DSM 19594 / LMG 11500 / NCIMB 11436 / LSU 4) TaxID=761193 RepID=A0A7U4E6Y0_RUNSL|nr:NUDIX domain-containing protein [Runella slithyformis]AEI49738.1 NUDIX hydrolase [Runella slithyformis DSM 19594]